ncbi:MAG: hypothetical protein EBY22_17530, partial [Gammaproteobacteria bacterium]|nr:hypothetical protein [Gammaproteobacteria bacterium]
KTLPHATIYFHWYEDEFARINASLEPEESHDELCRQRAQELRDTYKYLRLWFSGGSDSQTALNSFVNNNIHIDEIMLADYFDGENNSDPTKTTNREINLSAKPALKKILDKIPNTKITVIKATSQDVDEYFSGMDDLSKIPGFDSLDGCIPFGLEFTWAFCKISNQQQHEDVCDVFGGSKVKLFKNQHKWYFYFPDSSLSDLHHCTHAEDFFISRNIPKLYLKTVYLLKKYFALQGYSDQVINEFADDAKMGKIYNLAMGRSSVHEIAAYKTYVYTHNPVEWQNQFVSGWVAQAFYHNVINTDQGQRWHKNYSNTMRAMIDISDEQWNVDRFGNPVPILGRKGHLSKFYCLNDGLVYDSV